MTRKEVQRWQLRLLAGVPEDLVREDYENYQETYHLCQKRPLGMREWKEYVSKFRSSFILSGHDHSMETCQLLYKQLKADENEKQVEDLVRMIEENMQLKGKKTVIHCRHEMDCGFKVLFGTRVVFLVFG